LSHSSASSLPSPPGHRPPRGALYCPTSENSISSHFF
jgi:hypothetical protein